MIRALLLPAVRTILRALQTDATRVPAWERVLRGTALVPVFGALWAALRVRLLVLGPLVVEGETDTGVRMQCRLPDLIQLYVSLFRTWEPDLVAFVQRRVGPGDQVIDVGANVGCITALAGKLVGPTGAVVAIEPSPRVLEALRDTLARSGVDNVRIVEAAASDRVEQLQLFAGPAHNVGLTATVPHRGLAGAGFVPAAPLAELVTAAELARARLLKVDVEGAEDRVLAGLATGLGRLRADAELVVELSPIWWSDPTKLPHDVLAPFVAAGFHVYLLPNDYWPWRYLWPRAVGRPRRLRDLAVLRQRVPRLDVVLSRLDLDEL